MATTTPDPAAAGGDQAADLAPPGVLGALGALTGAATDQADQAAGTDAAEAETITRYYRLAGGGLVEMTASPPSALVPPEGGEEITEAEYLEAQAQVEADEAARLEEMAEERRRAAEARYRELRALGLSHELAAQLSGYTGPPIDPEPTA